MPNQYVAHMKLIYCMSTVIKKLKNIFKKKKKQSSMQQDTPEVAIETLGPTSIKCLPSGPSQENFSYFCSIGSFQHQVLFCSWLFLLTFALGGSFPMCFIIFDSELIFRHFICGNSFFLCFIFFYSLKIFIVFFPLLFNPLTPLSP